MKQIKIMSKDDKINDLIETLQIAYRKIVLNDEIAWKDVEEKIENTLRNAMGEKDFKEWHEMIDWA